MKREPTPQEAHRFYEEMGYMRGRRSVVKAYFLGLITGMVLVIAWMEFYR
jgi:hypothetical protein